jgi:hypothetical protein
MRKKYRLLLHLSFVFLFFSVSTLINFAHTERYIEAFNDYGTTHTHPNPEKSPEKHECPACHFLNSTINTGQIFFFFLPPPPLTGVMDSSYEFTYTAALIVSPSSRSPPSA